MSEHAVYFPTSEVSLGEIVIWFWIQRHPILRQSQVNTSFKPYSTPQICMMDHKCPRENKIRWAACIELKGVEWPKYVSHFPVHWLAPSNASKFIDCERVTGPLKRDLLEQLWPGGEVDSNQRRALATGAVRSCSKSPTADPRGPLQKGVLWLPSWSGRSTSTTSAEAVAVATVRLVPSTSAALDLQKRPENFFLGKVLGVQLPSQDVFGSLGWLGVYFRWCSNGSYGTNYLSSI